jgi:plasmid maintenance system antidote protein VapI
VRRRSLTKQAARLVKYLLDERRMTVTGIAEVLDVHKSFVSRCKNGTREFGPGQIERLADHLGLPPGAMLLAAHPDDVDPGDARVREARRLCREAIAACDDFDAAVAESASPTTEAA